MMSWLPFYNSWMAMMVLLSSFLWKLWGLSVFLLVAGVSLLFMAKEVMPYKLRHLSGFWLFIFSEVAIFASLFMVCLWSADDFTGGQISDWHELPFLGCFLLIGSSVTATAFHHSMGLKVARALLGATVVLGVGFVFLQMFEFHDCECDLLSTAYYATSFSTVGLHFSHVFLGLVVLIIVLILGAESMGTHYVNMAVWYWHFVDYIWLAVFTIIYLA